MTGDFMQGIFKASFGGISSDILPEEMETLKAAFDDMTIADQRNRMSDTVKYYRESCFYCSNGYIIDKVTPKTLIIRNYYDGSVLENITEEQRKEHYTPKKKVMTLEGKTILTGHNAVTIAAYEKAYSHYLQVKDAINKKIKDRFARALSNAIQEATKQPGDNYSGIYMRYYG